MIFATLIPRSRPALVLACALAAACQFLSAADPVVPPPDPIETLSAALLTGNDDTVRDLVAGPLPAAAPGNWRAIAAMAGRVIDWQSAVAKSFQEDMGKTVMVVSPTGSFTATVTGVNPREVRLRVFAQKGFEEQSLSFVNLTAIERERRLAGYTDEEKAVIAALSAVRSGLFQEAGDRLAEFGDSPLVAILISSIQRMQSDALEREADQNLRQLLDRAGLAAEVTPDERLLNIVRTRQFGARQAPDIREHATSFTNRFSQTQVGIAWSNLVELLCGAGLHPGIQDDANVAAAIAELQKKNASQENLQAGHIIHDGKLELDLSGNTRLKDISPLEKLRICDLDLTATGVRSLTSLRSMPLERLVLDGTQLQSLNRVQGCPLHTLSLTNAEIADLRPLKGAPLASINLYRSKVKSLAGLEGAPLKDVTIAETYVSDLKPLAGAPLTNLNASACPAVVDLRPLAGAPLESLYLFGTSVSDFRPLDRMPLKVLHCTLLADLSPLGESPLEWLVISGAQLSDLRPLRGKQITMLTLSFCPNLSDLSPLRGMPLTTLDLTGCPKISDLSPLREMPLTTLVIDGTSVDDDDTAIVGQTMPNLSTLFMSGCKKINDLTFLLSLKSLSAVSLPPGVNAVPVLQKHAAIAVVYENGVAVPVKDYIASKTGKDTR